MQTKKDEQKELRLEIKARQEVIRRLAYPLKQLQAADAKEVEKRRVRTDALLEYKTEVEIMDSYGYDMISDDERRELLEVLESGERYVADTLTPVGLALKILRGFVRTMQLELDELEFELLPPKEKLRRREEAEKRRSEIEIRRAARMLDRQRSW